MLCVLWQQRKDEFWCYFLLVISDDIQIAFIFSESEKNVTDFHLQNLATLYKLIWGVIIAIKTNKWWKNLQ